MLLPQLSDEVITAAIVELAFEKGILFLGCGPSTIRLCPPLVVTQEEADVAVDVLEECIVAVAKSA